MLEQESPVGTSVQLALSAPVVLHRAAGREAEALQPLLQLDNARLPEEATGKAWPMLISGQSEELWLWFCRCAVLVEVGSVL